MRAGRCASAIWATYRVGQTHGAAKARIEYTQNQARWTRTHDTEKQMIMRIHNLTSGEWLKTIGVGIATAILLSAVMIPALKLGIT